MSNIVLMTNSFPYYPGEQFLEAEIEILAQYFDVVYIVPFESDDSFSPRPLPCNVFVLNDMRDAWRKTRRNFSKRLKSLFSARKVLVDELAGKKRFFLFHPKAFLSLLKAASVVGCAVPCLEDIFRRYKPSIAYSYWLSTQALSVCLAAKRVDRKIFLLSRCHRYDLYEERHDPPYCPFQRSLLLALDMVLPISEHGRRYLEHKYSREKICEIKKFCLGVAAGSRALPSRDGIFRLVSCSAVTPVKRLFLVVQALRNMDFQISWTHIGDGPLYGELEEKISLLGKERKNIEIILMGNKSNREVLQYYEDNPVDLFINVSSSEGLPVSIMEAMSRGIPVMATDVGGTSEIVNPEAGTGFLLPENPSPTEIGSVLERFDNMSVFEKERMRNAAYDMWQKNFDANRNYRVFSQFLNTTSFKN